MTERIRLTALIILGALALAGLGCCTYLLAVGAPPEAALAVLALATGAGGAVGGALTLGRED